MDKDALPAVPPPPPLLGKRVTIMGLGRFGGGVAATRFLAGQGARILLTDSEPPGKLGDSLRQLQGLQIEYRLGEHRHEDFSSADLVVASPAVSLDNPFLQTARQAGVPITTEIRLFIERCPARRVIGVTGTKGKSTTTAMLRAMLARRFTVWMGGNIGRSLLADLPHIQAEDLVVLELSSFMLAHIQSLRWSPHVALFTMLAADHLDWHGSLEGYLDAKKNLVRFQKPADFAVFPQACPPCLEFATATPAGIHWYGAEPDRPFELPIPGLHNQFNAQGAFAAARCLGLSWDDAQAALRGFEALPHRLELVAQHDGVSYYNDSIATIPQAAIAALRAFAAKKVVQIVGGRLKDGPISQLCAELGERAKAVLCIGERGSDIAQAIDASSGTPVYLCGDLPTAMRVARAIATGGDVVLLSTGCKSYDQFDNFQQRGEQFRQLVK